MGQLKTPGVYIEELNAFPNSVVEVPTAVPAFIGYTEKAERGDEGLIDKPTRITSLAEYRDYFGGPPKPQFPLDGEGKVGGAVDNTRFLLYYGMRLFFDNGGGPCWVVSVGLYSSTDNSGKPVGIEKSKLKEPLNGLLKKEQEPTMIVVPDAVLLKNADWKELSGAVLSHCGALKSRIGILDIHRGDQTRTLSSDDVISGNSGFRTLENDFMNYGIAYYPWVNTSIVESADVDFLNVEAHSRISLIDKIRVSILEPVVREKLLTNGKLALLKPKRVPKKVSFDEPAVAGSQVRDTDALLKAMTNFKKEDFHATPNGNDLASLNTAMNNVRLEINGSLPIELAELDPFLGTLGDRTLDLTSPQVVKQAERAHKAFYGAVPVYRSLMGEIRRKLNLLPPSAGMAGVFTRVDNTQGVFKAPANTGMASVISPAVNISDEDQFDLNVPVNGKAINAIRTFPGRGLLVWGARTLDGNSQDWRYINVRRTLIMLEQSIKYAALAYVFEPNTSSTWVSVSSMIGNFLNNKWKEGALAGTTPAEAYSVDVGLGSTMTGNDILDGYMRVVVKVAVVRPAEFIVITFQQQMQTS